jgi:hypothetical protein
LQQSPGGILNKRIIAMRESSHWGILGSGRATGKPECMVRRRIASEK